MEGRNILWGHPRHPGPSFYDGCESQLASTGNFGQWMVYSMTAEGFHASEVVEAMIWLDLPGDVEVAYDSPFPSRIYMAGPRTFPFLVNEVPGTTEEAWVGLRSFEKPFLTLWASNDPGNLGQCATQQFLIDEIPERRANPTTACLRDAISRADRLPHPVGRKGAAQVRSGSRRDAGGRHARRAASGASTP